MERRVQKAEDDGLAVHDLQRALDGGLHVRLQVGQSGFALLVRVAENHLAHLCKREFRVLAVEHVLYTEEADAFCSELHCACCILRSICVGTDTELAEFVHDIHEFGEQRVLCCVHGVDALCINKALGAVEANPVAFFELLGVVAEGDIPFLEVDLHGVATYDAAFTPTTCYKSSVGGHTAAHGKDT